MSRLLAALIGRKSYAAPGFALRLTFLPIHNFNPPRLANLQTPTIGDFSIDDAYTRGCLGEADTSLGSGRVTRVGSFR